MQIATIGRDLAKAIFPVHGVDAEGGVVIRRRLRRAEVAKFFAGLAPCLVGMEACAGAHLCRGPLLGADDRGPGPCVDE
jgi:transposase